jgi:hypothetical protein
MLATTTAALAAALLLQAPTATTSAAPARAEEAAPARLVSLLGAETLDGGSFASASAGYSMLGLAYGQGLSRQDDLGASADFDWSSTELWLTAFWRRSLGKAGGWDMALRLRAGWYLDFGGTWIHDDNQSDRGLLLAPSFLLSTRAGDGLVSVAADLPLTFTFWRDGGFILAPKVSAAYETSLYGPVTIGVKAAVSWRGGGGDAPMRSGRVEPELLVLAGYNFL